MKVMQGLSSITSTHQGLTGYSHCWVSNLPAAETNAEPRHLPWGDRSPPGGRLITLDYFHQGRDSALFSLCTWICFPCMYCFCGLLECLIHHHSIPHSTASSQGIHNKWSAGIRSCSQTLLVLPRCPPSQRSWLDGWMAFWRPSYRCN